MTLRLPNETFPTSSPSEQEQKAAKVSAEQIAKLLRGSRKKSALLMQFGIEQESVSIPMAAAKMLHEILSQMAQGNSIALVPDHAELTTQEAADALNVSRPFLVKLLEEGKLPFRKVGTHRRIIFSDLMEYKHKAKIARLKVLGELQKQAQEEDMGY